MLRRMLLRLAVVLAVVPLPLVVLVVKVKDVVSWKDMLGIGG